MKKITKSFLSTAANILRETSKKMILIGAGIILSSSVLLATDYCSYEITSTRGKTAYVTCQSLGSDVYEFKFQALEEIVSWNATGSNFYAEVSGVGGTQVSNNLVQSSDKMSLTWTVTSNPKPNFYVAAFYVNFADGEHQFNIPTDENFAAVCGAPVEDTEAPASFTATAGNITSGSVELLLSATDNTSTIYYTITYGSTPVVLNTTGVSGTQKSYIVTGLSESTAYSFSVVAKDAAGNEAVNSPVAVSATTTENTNTECAGTSTEASDGSFSAGYNYEFTTSGTDVTVSFELLDSKDGVVAYAWTYNPNFAEAQMTLVSGRKFSKTFTGQTLGSTFTVACKFAYAGGLAVTKSFQYTVGENCSGSGETDTEAPTAFTATKGDVLSASVQLILNAADNSGAVTFDITYGETTVSTSSNSGVEKSYLVTGLTESTAYSFSVVAKDASGNIAANSPIVVDATTTAGLTTAAPVPAVAAGKVISVFSDTYTSLSGVSFNPNWGQSTVTTEIQVEGNNTLKYANLNYQGTDFGSDVDASSMSHLHVDVWTEDETSLRVYVISKTAPTEKYVELAPLNYGQWNSIDIQLSAYKDQGMSMAALYQFKFEGSGNQGSTAKTVYLDNLYFFSDTNTNVFSPDMKGTVNCYPNQVTDKLTVSADADMNYVIIRNLVGQTLITRQINGHEATFNLNDLSAGNYLVTVTLQNGEKQTRKFVKL